MSYDGPEDIDKLDWANIILVNKYYNDTIKMFLLQYIYLTTKDQNRLRGCYNDLPQYHSFQIVHVSATEHSTSISIHVEST